MGEQESKGLQSLKQTLILELEKRVKDKILENENKELLAKLISNADSITEAQAIMALGTTYKRTGFHFDKRLEKSSDKIFYFKKNEELSFSCDFWNKQGEGVKGEAEAVEMRNCGFQARNKGVTKAVMTEVEGEESTIYRSKQAKGEVSLVNATPLKHTLIIGDNYPALQNLLITYKEKVKVIYIDPPYGKDDLGEFAKTNYHNAITRDNLLSMLYPRLQLAKELLKDDGVIFCSIDDKNQAYVKCLFDEVFGEGNFVADFIRKTKSTTNDAKTGVNYQHEFLLCYAKNKENVNLLGGEKDLSKYTNPDNDPNGAWVSSDPTAKSGDMKTGYFAVKNPYTGKEDYPTNGRFWRFSQNTLQKHIDEGHICFKEEHKENERGFIYKRYLKELKTNLRTFDSLKFVENAFMNQVATKELLDLNLAEVFTYPKGVDFIKEILRHSTTPNTQTQATKEQFTPPPPQPSCLKSKDSNIADCHDSNGVSHNPQDSKNSKEVSCGDFAGFQGGGEGVNKALMTEDNTAESHKITQETTQGDIILDFFAGSGTTAHAVLELNREDNGNRQFILVTNNEITPLNPNGIAKDVTSKRLRRIMSGECYDKSTNFKWLEKNKPYGGILEVLEIAEVSEYEKGKGESAFEVIDETCYNLEPFKSVSEKIKWVCENFERAKKCLKIQGKSEKEWEKELNKRLKNGNTSDN